MTNERRSNLERWYDAVTAQDKQDRRRMRARFQMALTEAARGDLHRAAQMLAHVLASGDPDLAPRAAFERTLILRQLHDERGAERALAEADALADPRAHRDVKINVGLAWQQLGHLDRASNAYQAVLDALADDAAIGDGARKSSPARTTST